LMGEHEGPDYEVQYAITLCGIDTRARICGLVVEGVTLDPPDGCVCKVCLRKWKKEQDGKGAK